MVKTLQIKLWHLVGGVALILVIFYLLIVKVNPTLPPDYSQQKREIDSLKTVVKNYELEQLALNDSIKKYENNVVILNTKLDSIDTQINKVRNYYDDKIKNITSLSPTQLGEFFTKRYK